MDLPSTLTRPTQKLESNFVENISGVESLTKPDETSIWELRVNKFLLSQHRLHKVTRTKKVCLTIMLTFFSITLFASLTSPSISPSLFWLSVILFALSITCYPAIFLLERGMRKQRDTLSKKFYENNFELDFTPRKILLISRSSHEVVVSIDIAD